MPDPVQLQTYATCDPRTYTSVIRRFRDVLVRLGCTNPQVLTWLEQIRWPTSEDDAFGDVYPAPFLLAPSGYEEMMCAGMNISLYIQSAGLKLETEPSWVGLNLLFENEAVMTEHGTLYKPGVGATLWRIMSELAYEFFELGVYLADEWQENRVWRTLVEGVGEAWAFDLAIFPRSLSDHFSEVPAGFQGTVVERGFGFAQENRWPTLPWAEKASSRK